MLSQCSLRQRSCRTQSTLTDLVFMRNQMGEAQEMHLEGSRRKGGMRCSRSVPLVPRNDVFGRGFSALGSLQRVRRGVPAAWMVIASSPRSDQFPPCTYLRLRSSRRHSRYPPVGIQCISTVHYHHRTISTSR